MAAHNDLGREGEEAAARFLMFRDYSILARNWRVWHWEIDIIAEKKGVLVFVEVKTLGDDAYSDPEEKVTREKRKNLVQAANAYIHIHDLDQQVRFDVISVIGKHKPFCIRHIENAFEAAPDMWIYSP